jgi:hypothetical protein
MGKTQAVGFSSARGSTSSFRARHPEYTTHLHFAARTYRSGNRQMQYCQITGYREVRLSSRQFRKSSPLVTHLILLRTAA